MSAVSNGPRMELDRGWARMLPPTPRAAHVPLVRIEPGSGLHCVWGWRPHRERQRKVVFPVRAAMVASMRMREEMGRSAPAETSHVPAHVPSGAALLAVELSEEARGIRGLDILRRSVDRAPPVCR
jgi:hypothetical protein